LLNERKKCMNGSKVLLIGIAYKGDIDDVRESPALKVLENLERNLADVIVVDPYVEKFNYRGRERKTEKLTKELCNWADITIITTAHKKRVDYNMIVENSQLIFDTKNVLKSFGIKNEKVAVL
ncbi:MAG: UDP binding domain-containing protein, partial [Pseudothermotoga sp.]